MKKAITILVVSLCLIMTGCSNEFAEMEYDSVDKISKSEDRYAKGSSIFNTIDGGYELTLSKFDGRETLWSDTLDENGDIEVDFSFRLSNGQAKVVHIDDDGNVATIIECLPETSTDGFVTKRISLKSGLNRLKIVGYDCEDVELKMLFKEGKNGEYTD